MANVNKKEKNPKRSKSKMANVEEKPHKAMSRIFQQKLSKPEESVMT